jgi:hypothetical protein
MFDESFFFSFRMHLRLVEVEGEEDVDVPKCIPRFIHLPSISSLQNSFNTSAGPAASSTCFMIRVGRNEQRMRLENAKQDPRFKQYNSSQSQSQAAPTVVVNSPVISQIHATFGPMEVEEPGIGRGNRCCWSVVDDKSTNGTYVNCKRIPSDKPTSLSVGDIVTLGGDPVSKHSSHLFTYNSHL